MVAIDLYELRRRDPLAFHQRMFIKRSGELRIAKNKVSLARDATGRTRAHCVVDEAKSDVAYHKRESERTKGSVGEQS